MTFSFDSFNSENMHQILFKDLATPLLVDSVVPFAHVAIQDHRIAFFFWCSISLPHLFSHLFLSLILIRHLHCEVLQIMCSHPQWSYWSFSNPRFLWAHYSKPIRNLTYQLFFCLIVCTYSQISSSSECEKTAHFKETVKIYFLECIYFSLFSETQADKNCCSTS